MGLFLATQCNYAVFTFRLWNNGGNDGLWGTAANWSGSTVPNTSTQGAEFGSTAPSAISQNVGALTVGEILFDSGGISRTITGSALTLSGNAGSGIINNSSSLQTIGVGITLGAAQTFNAGTGGLTLSGNINNNGKALTMQGTANATVSGVLSGTGSLTKSGTGNLTLSVANTYSGATTISGGQIIVTADSALGSTAAGTTVNSGAGLGFSGGFSYSTAESLTINGTGVNSQGAITNISGNNTFAGTVKLNTASSIGAASSTTLTLSGVISGTGALTYSGPGTLLLSGNNTYTGATTINGGMLEVGANNALGTSAGSITVNSGGTLGFTGGITYSTAEPVTLNGTGSGNVGAMYNVSGNNSFAGPVTLGTASSIGAASGTTLTLSGVVSGTGQLTAQGPGTLLLSGNNTYSGATVVSGGYLAIQSNNSLGTTASGTTVNSGGTLELLNGLAYTTAESLTLNGTGVAGEGALWSPGTASFSGNIALGSAALITSSGTLTLSGTINNNGNALTFGGTGSTIANGVISGAGSVTQNGAGSLILNAANSFTGALNINNGTVAIGSSERLANTVPVNITAGGTLSLGTFTETVGSLTMTDGIISGSGTLALNGNVTGNAGSSGALIAANVSLGTGSRTFTIARGTPVSDMSISGTVSGTGSLTKAGAGILTLAGSGTYSGGTFVNAGTLVMGATDSLGTGALTISNGTVDAAFTGSSSSVSGITMSSGSLERIAYNGVDSSFASTIGITSTGTSTLRDKGGDTGGGLIINGAVSVNSGTLTLDATTANDSVTLNSGQNLNIAAGATVSTTGSGTVTVARTVVGNGTSGSESTFAVAANDAYTGTTAITVNGSGTGGLRVQGTGASVNSFLSASRLQALAGTGGTLTYAYTDNASGVISASPTTPSFVSLGFDGSGSYALGAVDNDLSTYNGLVVKGGSVGLAANETFVGQGSAALQITGGTLSLVDNLGFPSTLEFKGDATLTGGTLQGSLQAGAQAGTLIVNGNLTSSGTAFVNSPNITMQVISGTTYVQGSTPITGVHNFNKTGNGTLVLNNSVSVASLNLSAGTLLLGGNNMVSSSTAMNLSGGATFATGGYSDTLSSLTLANNSYIDMGNGSSILHFANSSANSWTGGTLTIRNWSGVGGGNGTDQILFGSTSGGLTAGQVSQIFFENPAGYAPGIYAAMILPWGEVVPVPEANTVTVASFLFGMLALRERKLLLLLGQKLHQISKVFLRERIR